MAATTRTSTFFSRGEPTGRISRSCRKRSSLTLKCAVDIADFIEKNGAAVGGFEDADAIAVRAGESAANSAEQLAFEQGGGMAPQSTGTKGCTPRRLKRWIMRATSSLPVPVSPSMRTVASVGATRETVL